jgi:hypothetical protein
MAEKIVMDTDSRKQALEEFFLKEYWYRVVEVALGDEHGFGYWQNIPVFKIREQDGDGTYKEEWICFKGEEERFNYIKAAVIQQLNPLPDKLLMLFADLFIEHSIDCSEEILYLIEHISTVDNLVHRVIELEGFSTYITCYEEQEGELEINGEKYFFYRV